jgi:FKBP-type peptidyl-prolyl cis-trans isomerase SlyD
MKIANNSIVSIHYTLTNDAGQQLDSSAADKPLVYLHGARNIIPGLEDELAGKSAGDQLQVTVQPEQGYGPVHQELVQAVPRSAFEGIDKVEPGMQFEARNEQGQAQRVMITAVNDESVTVDANHPLAGEVLHFDVTVAAVRQATEEELAHGHAH